MNPLTTLFGGSLKEIFTSVASIVDQFHTSGEEKLAAQFKLVELERTAQLKMIELDVEANKVQASTIIAEANSNSWLARSWRPLVMLFFCVIIGTIVWTGGYVNGHELDHGFIMEILATIKLGLGGYVIGRTVEKTVPDTAAAIVSVLKKK